MSLVKERGDRGRTQRDRDTATYCAELIIHVSIYLPLKKYDSVRYGGKQ